MKPTRIQLRRTKGWRLPGSTVVVSRPSKWGNPYRLTAAAAREYADNPFEMMADAIYVPVTQEAVVNFYRRFLRTSVGRKICRAAKKELRGKNLACWCKPGAPCHADVLLEVANK